MTRQVQERIVVDQLPVDLVTSDRVEFANEVADLIHRRDKMTKEFDDARKEHKGKLAEIEKRLSHIAACLHTGKEVRDVECAERMLFDRGVVEVHRKDTGELVRTRPIRTEERQTQLGVIEFGEDLL